VLAGLLVMAATDLAHAQVTIAPTIRELVASPGQTVRYRIGIANHTEGPLSCEVNAENMRVDEGGRPQSAPPDAARGCGSWLQLNPTRFRLAPKISRDVEVTVRVPRGAGGGYYAYVYCTAEEEGRPTRDRGAVISMRIQVGSALLLLVRSRQRAPSLSVESMGLGLPSAKDLSRSGWQATVRVVNKGTFHIRVTGEVEILDAGGSRVATAPLQVIGGYLLPDCPRRFPATGRQRLPDGNYTVVAHITPEARTISRDFSQSFNVAKGVVSAGAPPAEVKAYLESLRPRIRLEQAGEYLRLRPRGQRTVVVRFRNLTANPQAVTPSLYDWDVDSEGEVILSPAGKSPRSGCRFVSVQGGASAAARGTGAVRAAVQLPSGLSGEYRAALILNPEGAPIPSDALRLRQRACLLTLRAEGTGTPAVEIADLGVTKPGTTEGTLSVTVKNAGDLACPVLGSILVRDARGATVDEGLTFGGDQDVVVAGCLRRFSIAWPRALAPGRYVAVATVSVAGSPKGISREVKFSVKPTGRGG